MIDAETVNHTDPAIKLLCKRHILQQILHRICALLDRNDSIRGYLIYGQQSVTGRNGISRVFINDSQSFLNAPAEEIVKTVYICQYVIVFVDIILPDERLDHPFGKLCIKKSTAQF